jgi:hypothetical protein
MAGSVQNTQQVLPVPAGTEVPAASITGTGDPGLDGTKAPYTFLKDQANPGGAVPLLGMAQEGTDSSDAGALQGTAGVGIRGWLSTLVSLFRAQTATLSTVASSVGSVTLAAANSRRKGLCLQNDSTATLYVAYASSASSTVYTVKVGPGVFWEMDPPAYTGALSGLWDSQNGAARITEKS